VLVLCCCVRDTVELISMKIVYASCTHEGAEESLKFSGSCMDALLLVDAFEYLVVSPSVGEV